MAKRALCIGINDYPGTGSDLAGCVNDAHDWRAALEQRGFQVRQLLDGQATKQAMVAAIQELVQVADSGDIVIVQYSGHGSYIFDANSDEPDGTDEVLCPHDIAQNRPLSDDELHDLFSERQRGVKIVLISDSCHSGTVARLAPALEPQAAARRVRFLPPATFLPADALVGAGTQVRALRRPASPPGRHAALLMAGCQDTEYSYDAQFGGRPNGAFSYVALRALEALGEGATYQDWYQAIRGRLPSTDYPQTPNLFGSSRQKRWRVFE